MKTSTLFSRTFVILALNLIVFSACKHAAEKPQQPNISDVLEKALTGVVTIRLDEIEAGKNAFGFADDGSNKLNVSDIAYSEILKLENAKGTGSGFVIDREGKKFIVTNAHVVEPIKSFDKNIVAYSYDRKEHNLKLVGADSYYDIAVLEFISQPDSDLVPIEFADENFRIGQTCYAIGNPLSYFPYTVTQGIISAKNRPGICSKSGYIQSTAMLSSGNSGGPLINENGQLLGVNTLGTEKAQQLNFSLESKIVKRVVDDLIKFGRVRRAYFGLEIFQLNRYYEDKDENIVTEVLNEVPKLYDVIPASPAATNLADYSGYEIISANNKEITSNEDLIELLESMIPGDTFRLTLEKDGITKREEIIGAELNDERLSEIAVYYFNEHYNIKLTNNNSGIILNFPEGKQYNTFQAFDPQTKRFREYVPRAVQSYLIAMGNTLDLEDFDLWRINDYKDVGNALKLSTTRGQISFVEYDGKTSWINRVLISDRKDIISKTILY